MEIETQRQSAFLLLAGRGYRFVEEILAATLFIRFGLTKEHLLSRTWQRRRVFALQLVAFIMGDAI
jgi:hypothetical protein